MRFKHLTQSHTASEWESKDLNLAVWFCVLLLCCAASSVSYYFCLGIILTTPLKLLSQVIMNSKQILYFYRGIQSSLPYFTLLKHSPHPDLKSLHPVYVSLIVLTFTITVFTAIIPIRFFIISFIQQTIPCVRPWGYNSEQNR